MPTLHSDSARRLTVLRWMVGLLALHGVAFVIVGTGPTPADRSRWLYLYDAIGFVPLQLGAAAALASAARLSTLDAGTRRGLGWISAGFFVLTVASAASFVAAWDGTPLPFLSWADSIFLFFYPAVVAGLRSLPRVFTRRDSWQDVLSILSVVIAFGALITFSFTFELRNADVSDFERGLILASSSAQLLTLMTLNVTLERARRTALPAPLLLLFGTLAVSIITDLVLQIMYSVGYAGLNFGFPIAVAVNVAMVVVGLQLHGQPTAEPDSGPNGSERGLLAYSPLPIVAVSVLAVVAVWMSARPDVRGSIWLVVGLLAVNLLLVVRDVRASRLAAEALRRQAEAAAGRRLDALVRHGADAIVLLDAAGRITFASAPAVQIFGMAVDRSEGTLLSAGADETEREAFRRFLQDVRGAGGQPVSFVCTLRATGRLRRVEIVGIDLRHEEAVGGLVLHLRDVTEREDLQERLRHAQKLEVAGRLAAGIAHDFNNVLTAVQAGAELARLGLAADAPAQQDLATIEAAAQRGAALTRRLLTFVRQERMRGGDVPIVALVHDLAPLMQRLVGETIAVQLPTEDGDWVVRADRAELEHVLFNLLSNARDAMPTGGEIRVRLDEINLAQTPTDDAWVIAPEPGRYVALEVRDTGLGMSPDVRRRMFDPFFTMKAGGRGTGLGLIGVHPLVRGAGGGLAVESGDHGTTVRLLFPIVGSTQPAAVAAPATAAAPTRRARVLLVEDDPAVRQNLERLLSAHGFDADCVPGAADARARLAADATRYACVVTDVVMPGEDGMHLTSWIRATHATIPVLLISGHTGTALDDPHDLGEHIAFLRKPFSGQELASRLDALIDRRAPEAR